MISGHRFPFVARALACWNWKCALLSATARSIVYLAAMARPGQTHASLSTRLSIALVEMAYVTLTAGIYAGMQQKALSCRSRVLGNLTVVLAVPGLAQVLDWLIHRAAGAAAPSSATLAVCLFAAVSAVFHLYVMRRGAFLTGHRGGSLVDDFRRMPALVAGFFAAPVVLVFSVGSRFARVFSTETAT